MHRLVPLDATGDVSFINAMRRAWAVGDAVLPVDPRLSRAAAARLVAAMRPDDPVEAGDALVVATSGTTGEPKGVVLSHVALRASAIATSTRLAVDPRADTWLACLPLAHVGGLSVVVRALLTDTALVVQPSFDPARAVSAGATLVSLVATALRRLSDASIFRAIVLGGAAQPEELAANVVVTYGMTETGSGVVYDGIPLEGVDVSVGSMGAIALRGPMLLRCYRDGTDPKDAEAWLTTGDVGTWDGRRLTVAGRADELIISGGENVWPSAVEGVIERVDGVAEVAITGRRDAEWGQRVVALVVPVDPASPPALEALRDAVKEQLGPWAAPKELELVTSLPRTALGKLKRREL
ncbi:MAG: class I adenylate-forming enzyme family protein [Acidimicrobiales bacterium]